MRITVTLTEVEGGTLVTWLHENLPEGVRAEDNEIGTRMSLDNLAALVEARDASAARVTLHHFPGSRSGRRQ